MKLGDLKALGPLKSALETERRLAAAHESRRAAESARLERERTLFETAVGPITPLRALGRVRLARVLPAPEPLQRALDERAALRETWSDDVDVQSLLETDEALSFRRRHVGSDVPLRLRRGQWAIQAQVDLHGLRRDAARERLGSFLRHAQRSGLRCVRVVHGKGHGSPGRLPVLKGKVLGWLVQNADVLAFAQARPCDGGAGALLVLLRAAG